MLHASLPLKETPAASESEEASRSATLANVWLFSLTIEVAVVWQPAMKEGDWAPVGQQAGCALELDRNGRYGDQVNGVSTRGDLLLANDVLLARVYYRNHVAANWLRSTLRSTFRC